MLKEQLNANFWPSQTHKILENENKKQKKFPHYSEYFAFLVKKQTKQTILIYLFFLILLNVSALSVLLEFQVSLLCTLSRFALERKLSN